MLSLAAMIPMMAGRIDLTVGYGIVLWHILAIALQTKFGLSWPIACMIVLLLGCLLGLLNGFLVELAQIDSFIATLGTGTVLYAIALWYTEGRQVIGVLPKGFTELYTLQPLGIPDRRLLRGGPRPRAVDRHGIPAGRALSLRHRREPARGGAQRHPQPPLRHRRVRGLGLARRRRRHRPGRAAAHRAGERRAGVPAASPRRRVSRLHHDPPGPRQRLGHHRRRRILAVGISGIQQLGGEFYVEPLFNGVTLLIAIGLAGYAQRKRGEVRHQRTASKPSTEGPAS